MPRSGERQPGATRMGGAGKGSCQSAGALLCQLFPQAACKGNGGGIVDRQLGSNLASGPGLAVLLDQQSEAKPSARQLFQTREYGMLVEPRLVLPDSPFLRGPCPRPRAAPPPTRSRFCWVRGIWDRRRSGRRRRCSLAPAPATRPGCGGWRRCDGGSCVRRSGECGACAEEGTWTCAGWGRA